LKNTALIRSFFSCATVNRKTAALWKPFSAARTCSVQEEEEQTGRLDVLDDNDGGV